MEIQFPDIPLYKGWGHPYRVEATIHGLELVEGHLPPEIEGTLLRCGPDRQYPPRNGSDVFIDGEGMVHTFRFSGGQVDYMSRWVRTERFVLQEEARRALFGRYRNRFTNAPEAGGARMGTANTNLVFHAGKLLALKEDDLPYELDPQTLETRGHCDFAGAITSVSLSAHPKLDLVHDEMLTFSYQAKGDGTKDIVFYALNRDGRVVDEIWFEMPWPAMVHDFAVTPNYAVFPFFPFITDMEVVKRGGPFYQWHPDQETRVAIVPRHGTARDVRWFRGPTMSAGHMMNAYEDGSKLHLDVCLYDGPCFDFFPTPSGESFPTPPPILTQFTFDLSDGDGYKLRPLARIPGELPRTDDRYQGHGYQHGYMVAGRGADGSSSVGHVDHNTGKMECWSPGPASAVQESQFVPRRPDSKEGDGYLLTVVNRLAENHSDLAVLDARNVSAGPVALFRMPVRVRMAFHGTWVPAETFRTRSYAMEIAPMETVDERPGAARSMAAASEPRLRVDARSNPSHHRADGAARSPARSRRRSASRCGLRTGSTASSGRIRTGRRADRAPVLVFVHGGGFVMGDKGAPDAPFYNNVGLWAARSGCIGVTMTYRLAPAAPWPAGSEDVGAAVQFLHEAVERWGGDPKSIFLMGQSAGAVHVAGYVAEPRLHVVPERWHCGSHDDFGPFRCGSRRP